MSREHEDLHGLRRQRDPHAPKPWTPEPRRWWDWEDMAFAVALIVIVACVLYVILGAT